MSGPIVRWLHRHDPEWNALHKAIKVAVAVTVGLAIGTLVSATASSACSPRSAGSRCCCSPTSPAAVGPAGRVRRTGPDRRGVDRAGHPGLRHCLARRWAWPSSASSCCSPGCSAPRRPAATRAALLAFILPVTVPGTAADIPARLGGWASRWRWRCRWRSWSGRRAITTGCGRGRRRPARALASQFGARGTPAGQPPAGQPTVDRAPKQAILALRQQFRSTTYRPVGLDHRQSAADATAGPAGVAASGDRTGFRRTPTGWPESTTNCVSACAEVLDAGADVLADRAPSDLCHQATTGRRCRTLDRHRAKSAPS